MKLRYILGIFLSALLFTGCSSDDEAIGSLSTIQLDQTVLLIPTSGGDVTLTVNATGEWQIDGTFKKETKNDDGSKTTTYTPLPNNPAWLTVDKLSGNAGETKLTFHAEKTEGGRECTLRFGIGNSKQFLLVRQGSLEASDAKCSDIIAAPDGKNFRVRATITGWASNAEQYGNMWISDGTGEIQIYGMADKDGKLKNYPIASWGLEIGDVITVEGPKSTYKETVELVDVTLIKLEKSLIKVVTENAEVAKEGAEVSVKVAYKGSGAFFNIADDAKNWVTYKSVSYSPGVKTIFETNPADTAVYVFNIAPNDGATRTATIDFLSSNASSSSKVAYTVKQAGLANPPSGSGTKADPFNVPAVINYVKALGADVVSTDDVYVKGKISSIKYTYSASYGTATYNISADGKEDNVFTVYGSYFFNNKPWEEGQTQIAVGDDVVVCGKVIYYKGTTPEFSSKKNWLVSLNGKESEGGSEKGADGSTIISVAGFNAAAESTDVWYQLTGTVTNLKDGDKYGNFDLVDETGSVYVYGVLSTKGGEKKKFQELVETYGIKEGSTITIVGNRGSYNNKIEVMNAYFISVK